MAGKDEDLPLHAEAVKRAEWRGGETIIDKGGEDGLPASEVDNAASGDAGAQPDAPRVDLRPPD